MLCDDGQKFTQQAPKWPHLIGQEIKIEKQEIALSTVCWYSYYKRNLEMNQQLGKRLLLCDWKKCNKWNDACIITTMGHRSE